MLLYISIAQQTVPISSHTHSLVSCYNSGERSVIHCVNETFSFNANFVIGISYMKLFDYLNIYL